MNVDIHQTDVESLNNVDRKIITNIKKIVGDNDAFRIDVNSNGNNRTEFIFKGLKDSNSYIEDPIEMIRNEVKTISGGHFNFNISKNSASHTIQFTLQPKGYIHAKGYYRGINN